MGQQPPRATPPFRHATSSHEVPAARQQPVDPTPRQRAVAPIVGVGLVLRRVRVQARDVVFLKGVLEGYEGLATVFSERGGDLTIATTIGQESELDGALSALSSEIDGMLLEKSVAASDDLGKQQIRER